MHFTWLFMLSLVKISTIKLLPKGKIQLGMKDSAVLQ